MWQQLDCSVAARDARRTPSGCTRRPLPLGRGHHRRGQQRQRAAGRLQRRVHGRRLDVDGLLQRAAGRRAVLQVARRHVRDERQLPPVDRGRHGRQPRRARHGRRGSGTATARATRSSPPALEIENPDPQAGTNNWYTQDGYSGGTYSDCADETQPGVDRGQRLPASRCT